jgi:DNA-directed RNA polymerase specialized sigma24 family protein
MPLEQIATRLDLPLGTVKSRLHYALRVLAREIDR